MRAPPSDPAADRPVPRRCGLLPHAGEDLYWEELGTGPDPAAVLCHGFGGSHAVWFQQVPVWARTRRVIVWDHRGFGRSSDRAGASGPEAAVGDLRALLDHLAVREADLVGQSMGGWTALGLALAEPARVRSLVLPGTLAGCQPPAVRAAFRAVLRRAAGEPAPDARPLGDHPALGPRLRARHPERALLYQQLASVGPPPPADIPRRLLATAWPEARLAALDRPALFVVGEDDALFPPEVVREAAALLPRSRVEVVPGAGHSPYFEEPDDFHARVLAFWADPSC